MATPSGQIGFSDVNLELGVSPTSTQVNIGSAAFRTLAGVPSGQISMNNLRGKSNSIQATATGNVTTVDSDGYRIHVFTGPGSFIVSSVSPAANTVEYLVVAGGGAGGQGVTPGSPVNGGGGGGAGGFRTATGFPVTATTYPITVGGGGSRSPDTQPFGSPTSGYPGSDSVFSTITSTGGGGGAGSDNNGTLFPAKPGGSGGGGKGLFNSPGGTGNTPPVSPSQGNPGGNANPGGNRCGGGGGAGAAGGPADIEATGLGGPGGVGRPITWIPASYGTPGPAPGRWFGGGGGGSFRNYASQGGSGGAGGGGNSFSNDGNGTPAGPGATNTGGGGGGNGPGAVFGPPPGGYSGNGGSGIVVIRYPI